MRILVTGSAGHLGEALVRSHRERGDEVVGLDLLGSAFTTHVGSIADSDFVRRCTKGWTWSRSRPAPDIDICHSRPYRRQYSCQETTNLNEKTFHGGRSKRMLDSERAICDFQAMQYNALRTEILGTKERIIRLQIIGVTGIPLFIGAGEKFELSAVILVAPLITIVFAFVLIFEQGSLMRAGEYIKDHLEVPPLCPEHLVGWEEWLEEIPRRRLAEAFFAWAAYIAFAVYFAIGTFLAYQQGQEQFGLAVAFVILGLYCGGFLLALFLVVTNLHTRTTR